VSVNAFGWLLVAAFVAGVWATDAFVVPRLTRAGLWAAFAVLAAALVLYATALVWLS
jgi:hypothetical protein